jgi:hypothetical protein
LIKFKGLSDYVNYIDEQFVSKDEEGQGYYVDSEDQLLMNSGQHFKKSKNYKIIAYMLNILKNRDTLTEPFEKEMIEKIQHMDESVLAFFKFKE